MPVRYRTPLEDSARWEEFRFRDGDIVISAPAKSGTTWVQMICALLIFQTADLPAALPALSPWLDTRVRAPFEVGDLLAVQGHRRFIKTHTPLDGIPLHDRVTYVVIGRDPRDVAVSLHHQRRNLKPSPLGPRRRPADVTMQDSLRQWLDSDEPPQRNLVTLKGMLWHLTGAWTRRRQPNVVLLHYSDLSGDLDGQMRMLASRLNILVSESAWPGLVEAATFGRMRQRSAELAPDTDLLKDSSDFFRAGRAGGWRAWLTDEDQAHYHRRVSELASPDLIEWLHREPAADPAQCGHSG